MAEVLKQLCKLYLSSIKNAKTRHSQSVSLRERSLMNRKIMKFTGIIQISEYFEDLLYSNMNKEWLCFYLCFKTVNLNL